MAGEDFKQAKKCIKEAIEKLEKKEDKTLYEKLLEEMIVAEEKKASELTLVYIVTT